jgi:hypothetical protein
MLTDETATNENWEILKERLPPAIERFSHFTGIVWSCDITEKISTRCGARVTSIVHFRDPSSDPLRNTPANPLSEPTALKAFEAFPESVALLKFLDGTFIVVYPENTDCLELMDMIPTTSGGLAVDTATDKMIPCMKTGEIKSASQQPADAITESDSQNISKGSRQVKPKKRTFCPKTSPLPFNELLRLADLLSSNPDWMFV